MANRIIGIKISEKRTPGFKYELPCSALSFIATSDIGVRVSFANLDANIAKRITLALYTVKM